MPLAEGQRVELQQLLNDLKDVPVNTEDPSDNRLPRIHGYLMTIKPDSNDTLHWFCAAADPVTVDAATFLIRLHAYNNARVEMWRERLKMCLNSCAACVKGFMDVRISSRHTFFGAFSDEVVENFYGSFDKLETMMVLDALEKAGVSIESARTLSDAPAAVVYHAVANPIVMVDPRVLSIIRARPPVAPFTDWPTDPPATGLLYLLFDQSIRIQQWAKSVVYKCQDIPIPLANFITPYKIALQAIVGLMSTGSHSANVGPFRFDFVAEGPIVWSGFWSFIRLLPFELLKPSKYLSTDLRHLVVGHLHNVGHEFPDVLRCLIYLIKKLGPGMWQSESAEYPHMVFDAIKDNPSFSDLILTALDSGNGKKLWFLVWFSEYLRTLWHLSVFGDILAKVVDFMCEELQHERFRESRPTVMANVLQLLLSLYRETEKEDSQSQSASLNGVLDIHAEVFVAVAFGRLSFSESKWNNARVEAQELLRLVLLKDIKAVSNSITNLCLRAASPNPDSVVLSSPSVHAQMWKRGYEALQSNDPAGVAMVISVAAQAAHIDVLTKEGFYPGTNTQASTTVVDSAVSVTNRAILVFRHNFRDAVSKFANYNTSSTSLDLLRRSGMVKDIVTLMLSPVDDFQAGAQALVGQAFDVDVRMDCFRALLENLPNAAFAGILEFLERFIQYATKVPEACSLSKSLVRCLTDVIEVLCSTPDGLLHNQRFLRGDRKPGEDSIQASLPKLWTFMTRTITVIFKRTPSWSAYFENNIMIEWMRDALIFGRDLLAQRRVIEYAALPPSEQSLLNSASPGKLSKIGTIMVNDLQNVLLELTKWLRLTDDELLHQSFSLLQSLLDCFRETRVPPSQACLEKLNKHLQNARKKDPKQPQTKLDEKRLLTLEAALSVSDTEDEIHIISHKPAPSSPTPKRKLGKVEVLISRKSTIKGKTGPSAERTTSSLKVAPLKTRTVTASSSKTSSTLPHRSSMKSKHDSSSMFTTDDQKRLNAQSSFPKFTKIVTSTKPNASSKSSVRDTSYSSVKSGRRTDGAGKAASTKSGSASDGYTESSDDDDARRGLASLAELQLTPRIKKKHVERRQVKAIDIPSQRLNPTLERLRRQEEAMKLRLRMKPDISSLHRMVLSWNYDHNSPQPPFPDNFQPIFTSVPDKFSDHENYFRVLQPLLFLECWAQIMQSKEEPTRDQYQCTICSRQYVDDWIDIDIAIEEGVRQDWRLMDTDVVLLRHLDGQKCTLAKVQGCQNTRTGLQATIRCHIGANDPGLQINTKWHITKVFSLSTIHREYAALVALPYYDCLESVLHPQLTAIPKIDLGEIKQTMEVHNVNQPQAVAILASMSTDGFALIQGPPGTGKTWTICGLIATFLSRRPARSIVINAGRNATANDKVPLKKVLLCAPSNAAIDEIAKRLKGGLNGADKRHIFPKVVRVGAETSINISVKEISLDYLVVQKLNAGPEAAMGAANASSEIATLRAEMEALKRERFKKQQELSLIRDNAAKAHALEGEIQRLNSRRMTLSQQSDKLRDKQRSDYRTLDAARRRYRHEILAEADVICSTLSGAGHEMLEELDFEMVIIDEAAQSIELSSLIPLKYRCKRCIMVGDPQQLPPTVLSQEACKYRYNQSLFVRFQKYRPEAVHLLSIQYRMHPEISQLPSRVFYNGRLQDGPSMAEKTAQPWHSSPNFGPYMFFNASRGGEEQGRTHSLMNREEVQVILALFSRLRKEFSAVDFDFRVGIVSMYRAQVVELRRLFERHFGSEILGTIDFNTVDGFQGQEKDVIILSCVRAGPGVQSVGFLSDTRRMNVAITRARSSLFIVGHAATLERSDDTWRAIVQDARSRSHFQDVDPHFFALPSTSLPAVPTPRTKPAKPQVSIPVIPADLLTPREFKAMRSQLLSQAVVQTQATSEIPAAASLPRKSSDEHLTRGSTPSTPEGLKRPLSNTPDTTGTETTEDLIRRPPKAKRPKATQSSIFIPKPTKRPLPEDSNSAQSSNIRRRL